MTRNETKLNRYSFIGYHKCKGPVTRRWVEAVDLFTAGALLRSAEPNLSWQFYHMLSHDA